LTVGPHPLALQRLHAGKLLALHPFEEGDASGQDEAEIVGNAGRPQSQP
jgi:hypothetical protein